MGTFIIVNEYLENLKSLYAEFKTNQTNLKEVEIIPNVQELLENRYFVNLFNGKETKYEQLCRRVSRVIAATEISHAHLNTDIEMDDNNLLLCQIKNIENSIYTDMINGNFLFNSPCLFSAGTGFSATENGHLLYDDEITLDDYRKIYENSNNKNQMLFACFVIGIEDSIEGIFDAVKKCAIISKAGGGVGLNFSPLREKNAKIRDNEGLASGVVSFAGDFNAMGDSIRQGGKRRVALMGMLNSNHPDIEEFINCKTEEGKLTNFNISVAIDDKFMEAIQNDSDYDLISSVDGHIVKTVKARELWNNICESAHRRGDPGIFFIDLTNKDSLLKNDEDYYINSTNPCSTGDTLVATPNGWKRADSFNVGDEIITVNGIEKIQDIEINDNIDVYQVDFADGGSVKVTPSHQFMWVNKQNSNITEFRQLKELQVGDNIKICPSNIPDNHTINTFGLSEFDYGLILGALLGDGCVTETAIKVSSVRVSFGRQDTQWQQYFENVLTKYNIQYHVNEKRTAFDVVFNKGTVIYDIIDNINLTGYSYNKRIPIEIVNSNKDILSGLLNGYFSTDGNVNLGSTRPQIRLTSCNLELLQDVRLILLMFGISCTVHTVVRDHSIIEGRLVNSRNKYTLIINSISLITFLNEIGLKHQEKLNKLNSCFENYKPMNHRWRTTIKNITYIGKEKVYDLHAPKSDTWLTNGYVSRGCGEANLPNFTSCNLGSINLANFVTNNNEFDFDEFIKMVRRGIYYLDLVIDTSAYPLPEIEERTKAIRPVGLGIMGLADMFIKLGIKYGSNKSNKLSEQIAQIMAAQSLYESVKLAEIKGSFEQFDIEPQQKLLMTMYNEMVINYGIESANNNIAIQYIKDIIDGNIKSILPISIANAFYSLYQYNKEDFYKIFHKFEDGYLRNSRRLSVAPTGTISMILNTSSSLEPNFAFEWKRNITNSNGTVETKIFKHKYADIENKELLVTANELTPDEHVNIVKAFAPYIDASISKCVAKGTQIQTNKGIINIEDFGNPNKEIDTFEDISDKNIYVRDMNGDWKKVLSHYRGGTKKTYIIKLKDGFTVECSENHKFMIVYNENKPNEWLSAKDIYKIYQEDIKGIVYLNDTESGKNDCCYKQIDSITKSTNEVYDIEVEDTHSYLISGLVSHNTVNLSNSATVEDVKKVYENCYNNGIKGITIYRDMSREGQTLQKIDNNKPENKQDNKQDTSSIVNNIERPKVIIGFTQKGETNYGNLYATLNVVDGKPYELFVNIGKSGSLAKSLSEALSRTISISLQNGINIDEIIKTLNGIADSETPWVFEDYKGNEEWCKSIPDMIAKMMKSLSEYVKEINAVEQNITIKNVDNTANEQNIDMSCIIEHDKCSTDKKKILCPECLKNGNEIFLVQLAGCPTCPSCGWSACA